MGACERGIRVDARMEATRGTLSLLQALSEGPQSNQQLLSVLEGIGMSRDERTLRRYLGALRDAGFQIDRSGGRYDLLDSPVKLPLSAHEALATLNVLQSLAKREPVYGEQFASAAQKVRKALPKEVAKFVDRGSIEFELTSASDPPEDPRVIDTLRQAIFRHQRVEMLYHSLSSGTTDRRTVEPLRVAYAQKAHRLYAYEPDKALVTEFRINRIKEARMLPDKFSPEAHISTFDPVSIRLSENAFIAYGKSIIPDDAATIECLEDGGAIIEGTTPSVFWTVREIVSLGSDAEVLGGPTLKEEFLRFVKSTLDIYS